MLTLIATLLVSQTPPEVKAIAAENRASYQRALADKLAREKLTRVDVEFVVDGQVTKPGYKNVKLGAWHEPPADAVLPFEPVLLVDAKGVAHVAWPQAKTKKTVVLEGTPAPTGPPPPMRELRALVPEAVDLTRRGNDLEVVFVATTVSYQAKRP
jgi:hypothetical protein